MVIQNLNKMKNTTQGRLNGNKLSPAVQGQLHEIAWCTREIVVQRLACASNPVSGCKDSVGPQITKDRLSHVMAFPWSSDCRWQSTGIWFYIDCHYHNLRMLTPRTQYIGSELTRKGMCEQARHVMLPQEYMRVEYDVTMKTRTNQPLQKYRCLYKAFKWSKHSQKRCGSFYNIRQRNVLLSWEFCVPVVHISCLEVAISLSVFIPNQWVYACV